jgi:signal transduction histidine kinase/CheY-like chemotaxis protein/HPt (histidine-containing phosphotransfer) domain-containing protein
MHFSLNDSMKKIRIEIQTALLALIMIVAVAVSGFYFFSSLAGLVDVVHRQAKSDPVLKEIRSIASVLTEVENTARLYILSGDGSHLIEYRNLNDTIVTKLQHIDNRSQKSYFEVNNLDSLRSLALKRLIIWNEILDIHLSATDQTSQLPQIARRIMTAPADTVEVEVARKGKLANLFRKRKTELDTIITPSANLDGLQKELEYAQRSIQESSALIKSREAELVEANHDATVLLFNIIWQLEEVESNRMEANTVEAGMLAAQAKKRVMLFGVIMIVLIIVLIWLVFRFIRKNRETQRVLVDSKKQAEVLARTKEMFIANVSHEMRTPVNAVYGVTEQILQRDLDDRLREDLTVVRNSARHLLSLVNDTLDLAKINANLLSISSSDYSPDSVFKEAIELVKPLATTKNIELLYEKDVELPDALKGDPVRLKQMVLNLLSNAVKFTEKGFVKLEVICTKENEKIILHVTVSDTGSGIADVDLPRVFDEFMQSEGTDPRKYQGTGLGLAIVKKLAELQNGTIEIKSQPGQGTEVSFSITCTKGDPGRIDMEEELPVTELNVADTFNILIVDDEPYNIHLLRMILEKWGIQYSEASDGQQAVEMALENDYDLILMDIRMPVMDGFTASSKILEAKPDSVIIALTATIDKDEVHRIVDSGMKDSLRKPLEEPELARVLNHFFSDFKIDGEKQMEALNRDIEVPDIDLDELYRISDNNKSFYLELIQIFINSTERGMKKMREALSDKNYRLISDLAHKMSSPVKHILAKHLYSKLKELETMDFSNTDKNEAGNLIDTIEQELKKINSYLKSIYEKEKQQVITGFPDNN